MSKPEDGKKEISLGAHLGEETLACLESMAREGWRVGTLMLVRQVPGGDSFKYVFVTNSALGAGLSKALSVALEQHGFPRCEPEGTTIQ